MIDVMEESPEEVLVFVKIMALKIGDCAQLMLEDDEQKISLKNELGMLSFYRNL